MNYFITFVCQGKLKFEPKNLEHPISGICDQKVLKNETFQKLQKTLKHVILGPGLNVL